MGVNLMQGTSAYIEYIDPKGKKYKKNCYYNDNDICTNKNFSGHGYKCVGRLICMSYTEKFKTISEFNQCLYYKNGICYNEYFALYLLNCCKNNNCIALVSKKKKKYIHNKKY